ncbi:serine hydrolase [Microbacterium imperiale]|uniref:Serine hydrolase n=1 Tax=Microbacterium imperiale TaxID=33884 RepID=A0A9W6M479_9MICO|nr:class A beta-lactamase-related serine hydrolase [Microbacterium imperiale]BFE41688.1 serine hydrolase [Microbacterium imperiale]GLJ80639.1 serine hydrolase [Microbacterium imperiale]
MSVDGSESSGTARSRAERRTDARPLRRSAARRRGFAATEKALDALAASGARVSVRVSDLDRGTPVLAGDDFITLPVAGLGIVPLLIEVAARFEAGGLDPLEIVERSAMPGVAVAGVWRHLAAPALPLGDLAVLAAATGDALAANALLDRVGLDAVRARLGALGMPRTALLDRFRDDRGPDDAPHYALGTARELASMFAALVNTDIVSPGVSAQVSEWLSLNHDLSLVGSVTGLDPFAHDDDKHELLFVNKTGRADGIRAEAGVLAGPRAGLAYALIVEFDDPSMSHRLRSHEAFRALGLDLMEYVF